MNRITRAKAVKYFCMACMGWDGFYGGKVGTGSSEAVKLVRECESKDCPLYNFRTGRETTPGLPKKFSTEQLDYMRNNAKSLQKSKKVSTYAQV